MKRKTKLSVAIGVAIGSLLILRIAHADYPSNALEQDFKNPPEAAKPRTWWHWTNGNVTKEGITKDLEWMKRVGIGGMQLADVASGGGQTVEKKILFGTPEWLDAVRHAASEANRLGLEMAIFSSAGWSETGGPWVKPEQAMKKLVWSETVVDGPRHFSGKLSQPPSFNGPIRNLKTGGRNSTDATFYGDSAVVAYRMPADEGSMAELKPKVTANSGSINGAALIDDDLNTAVTIAAPGSGAAAGCSMSLLSRSRPVPSPSPDPDAAFRSAVFWPATTVRNSARWSNCQVRNNTVREPCGRSRFPRRLRGFIALR